MSGEFTAVMRPFWDIGGGGGREATEVEEEDEEREELVEEG